MKQFIQISKRKKHRIRPTLIIKQGAMIIDNEVSIQIHKNTKTSYKKSNEERSKNEEELENLHKHVPKSEISYTTNIKEEGTLNKSNIILKVKTCENEVLNKLRLKLCQAQVKLRLYLVKLS